MTTETELYKKYRPRQLSDIVGQSEAVRVLGSMVKKKRVPRFLLMHGPTGCGKTSIARIMRRKLKCQLADFREINAADTNGIEVARDIRRQMGLAPMGGKGSCRIFYIDEAHRLTTMAQDALLKMLEDTPKHVHFFFATTDPNKVVATLRSRATMVGVKLLTPKDMESLLTSVMKQEGIEIGEAVIDLIVQEAGGSARQALVLLNHAIHAETEEDQLAVIKSPAVQQQAVEVARVLMRPNCNWRQVTKVLKEVDEDAETIRHIVLAYFTNVLLGGGKQAQRAAAIIECFADNFYDSKRAGLVLACYNIVHP